MSFVGVCGVLLSLLAFAWFSPIRSNFRLAFFLVIVLLHLTTAFIYFVYVQTSDSDTSLYYNDPYGFFANGFGLSTMFVVYLTQSMRNLFGGTYLDYFLLYQTLGLWGLALLMRTLDEIALTLETPLPPLVFLLMFLPGMYFWTSAIGKDAPLFFAAALAMWSSLNISKRWMWFGMAVVIMVLFRAHIAMLTIIVLSASLLAGRGVSTAAKLLLGSVAIVAGVFLFGTLQTELGTDLSSIGSVTGFFEQQTTAATTGGDATLANAPFLFKVFSLLYRPLFIDAGGFFGLVASLQNVAMLAITFLLIRNFRLWTELFRSSLAIRFATLHFIAVYLLLAMAYYNVGLGLRQREMGTPALLVVFGAVWMVSRLRQRAKLNQTSDFALLANVNRTTAGRA
jgi:hypothetical protein